MVRVNRINGFVMMLENRMKDVVGYTGDYLQTPKPAGPAWHRLLGAVREARGLLYELERELSFDVQEPELEEDGEKGKTFVMTEDEMQAFNEREKRVAERCYEPPRGFRGKGPDYGR